MKVKVRVMETYAKDYVVNVPDNLEAGEIGAYVDEGISCGEYDLNPTTDSVFADYDRNVEHIGFDEEEQLKMKTEDRIKMMNKAIEIEKEEERIKKQNAEKRTACDAFQDYRNVRHTYRRTH